MMKLRMIGLAALTALAPGLALAEGEWTIGIGAAGGSNVYRNQKDEVTALPFLAFDTERLHFGFDGISYKAITNESFDLSLVLAMGDAPDVKEFAKRDARFAGLKRDTPVELGLNAEYRMGALHFGAAFMHDVAEASDGYHAEATVGASLPLGNGVFDIGIGARMRDRKLNNHLYGVSASEANGLRPAYDVGSTVQPFLTGSVMFPVSEKVAVMGFFEYEKLDKKVSASPLVDAEDSYSVGLGVVYKF